MVRDKEDCKIDPGSTLAFLLVTSEWTIQGLLGDSPIAIFTKDGKMEALKLQSA